MPCQAESSISGDFFALADPGGGGSVRDLRPVWLRTCRILPDSLRGNTSIILLLGR
jgi:hypothetical protein